jgi:hypothetical protein
VIAAPLLAVLALVLVLVLVLLVLALLMLLVPVLLVLVLVVLVLRRRIRVRGWLQLHRAPSLMVSCSIHNSRAACRIASGELNSS